MGNLDTTLAGLAAEVNALEADRVAGNQGKMVEIGHKIIAIRQILRETNGETMTGGIAPDGRAPVGWTKWVKENLSISRSYAQDCVQHVFNPEVKKRRAETNRRSALSPTGALQRAKRAWPNWTQEQRNEFSAGVLALLKS